ncbi:hypothetical protein [Stappia sp. ES.058]|uniref:hypothetical protein n=1 Tax=Stappia sp. ES.058 TaxID=1881061 RepID=UPI00087AE2E8|nr:hypothetical protein [Stappia sp. ES.058]SDT88115.1 hypothetical protein SAMN05428979_0025 [Stappia sp. ES.058]
MTRTWRILLTVYFTFVTCAMAMAMFAPGASSRVAVIVWPGSGSAAAIVAAAEGDLLQLGSGNWIAIANGEGGDFAERLYRAGAFLVTSPSVAEACL